MKSPTPECSSNTCLCKEKNEKFHYFWPSWTSRSHALPRLISHGPQSRRPQIFLVRHFRHIRRVTQWLAEASSRQVPGLGVALKNHTQPTKRTSQYGRAGHIKQLCPSQLLLIPTLLADADRCSLVAVQTHALAQCTLRALLRACGLQPRPPPTTSSQAIASSSSIAPCYTFVLVRCPVLSLQRLHLPALASTDLLETPQVAHGPGEVL